MSKNVYVVHCVDTEGPLFESRRATFERLREIFGVELEPTEENLRKIQNGEIDLNGRENLVADAFAEKRISTLGTWDKIDSVLDKLMSDNFRNTVKDSDGNGWVYNWFALDHVGFSGKNPRRRDAGFGNVYLHYKELVEDKGSRDLVQFHYHPLPFNGHYNYCGTAYVNSNNIFEILCHRIIDNDMFPAAYRAGMEAERPDSHWFLEQWIPFDYSNDSFIKENRERQPDLRNGRYGDWRRASLEWHPYHPSHDNYQLKGYCHRWITRCISLDSRVAKLEIEDVREAFRESYEKDTIIAFANHDFRDMTEEVLSAMRMFELVSKEFPDVKFHYSDAITAMREAEQIAKTEANFDVKLGRDEGNNALELRVKAHHDIFGSQPFLAIKTITGQYFWDNFDYGTDGRSWSYVFDDKTIPANAIEIIGFASNSADGQTCIVNVDLHNGTVRKLLKDGHRTINEKKDKITFED